MSFCLFGYFYLLQSYIRHGEARQHDSYCIQKRPFTPEDAFEWKNKQKIVALNVQYVVLTFIE